jgi:hypothetical protein
VHPHDLAASLRERPGEIALIGSDPADRWRTDSGPIRRRVSDRGTDEFHSDVKVLRSSNRRGGPMRTDFCAFRARVSRARAIVSVEGLGNACQSRARIGRARRRSSMSMSA